MFARAGAFPTVAGADNGSAEVADDKDRLVVGAGRATVPEVLDASCWR